MVEGHQCHRLAYAHKKLLLGHAFKATSPNKRFEEGAGAINGVPLDRIEVHGKNMFYFFGPTVVHIHFGMSGQFKTVLLDHAPEPTPTTRLALVNENINMAAFLSAMTVQHGPISELYDKKIKQLGPDPLRDDADPTRFWEKLKKSKQPIGKILMDQSCIAGLGNIYRAEVLFKTGVHPEQPGTTITEEVYEKLWKESVWCLQRGFQKGSILTVNPGENLGKPWTRRYVYNHKKCGRCNSSIKSWDIATRRVYACLTCQPLLEAEIEESRKKALAEAGVPILFASRCAADAPEDKLPEQMTVKELQDKLQQAGQQTNGTKTELIRRLSIATQQSDASSSDELDDLGIDMKILDVAPGTKQIEKVATAKEAAQEKQEAGENRAVEHIALIIDEQLEKNSFQSNSKNQGKKRSRKIVDVRLADQEDVDEGSSKQLKLEKNENSSAVNIEVTGEDITKVQLQKTRVQQLQQMCIDLDLHKHGKKAELIERLLQHFSGSKSEHGQESLEQKQKLTQQTLSLAKKVPDVLKPHKLRVPELKSYLQEMGLSTEGKRQELILRLQQAIWGQGEGSS